MICAFLLYVNRSGSTFLAAQLARRGVVASTIESKFFPTLLGHFPIIESAEDLSRALDLIYEEDKFRSWGIDRSELDAELRGLDFPLASSVVFEHIVRRSQGDSNAKACIYKCSRSVFHWEQILERLPDAKFVHIVRDPRAVFGSQARAKVSGGSWRMADDAMSNAAYWSKYSQLVRRIPAANLLEIKYEQLVMDSESTLSSVEIFLAGVDASKQDWEDGDRGGSTRAYDEEIPEAQRRLHTNVGKPPMESRLNGWENEISKIECALIQDVADAEMAYRGYEKKLIPGVTDSALRKSAGKLGMRAGRIKNGGRRLLWYLSRPRDLLKRVRERTFE